MPELVAPVGAVVVAAAAAPPSAADTLAPTVLGSTCCVNGSRALPIGCEPVAELLTEIAATGVPAAGDGEAGSGVIGGVCGDFASTTGTATMAAIRASGIGHSRRWRRSVRIALKMLIAVAR